MFKSLTSKIQCYFNSPANQSEEKKKPRRRKYLAAIYNTIKSAYQNYEKEKTNYDPFQVDQLDELYQYNPYSNHQETIMSSCEESTVFIDKEYQEEPVKKKLRTMATSAAENAMHTFVYGAMVTFDFVWSEKKCLQDYVHEKSTQIMTPPEPKMRGFGVDFCPVVDRSPALKIRMDIAERNIRDICKRAELSVQESAYKQKYRLPLKRSRDDEDWGLVEKDYSVRFKF